MRIAAVKLFTLLGSAILLSLSLASSALAESTTPSPTSPTSLQTESFDLPESVKAQLDALDISEAESIAAELVQDNSLTLQSMLNRLMNGEAAIDVSSLTIGIMQMLANMLRARIPFILAVMSSAILGALAVRLCPHAPYLGELTCVAVASGSVLADFIALLNGTREAVNALSGLTQALFPLLLTLLSTMGGQAASGMLRTASVAVTGVTLTYARDYSTALLSVSAALTLLGCMTSALKTDKLAALMRTFCHLLLGGSLVMMLGVISIHNGLSATVDGVSVRTAKYALDNVVPIVGGEIADTVEVIAASCGMAQTMLGTAGITLTLIACLRPALVLLCAYMSYKMCAAVLEVAGDDRVPHMLDGFAAMLMTLLVTVLGICALFIMLLGACMQAGQQIMMLR